MKEELAKWLNKQVEIFTDTLKYRRFDVDGLNVSNCTMPSAVEPLTKYEYGVHLSDVREVAKILDLEVTAYERKSDEYPIELHFVWNNVIFFSIHERNELNGRTDISGEV